MIALPRVRNQLDLAWKEALTLFFPDFLAFFAPAAHAAIDWAQPFDFLDSEVRRLRRGVRGSPARRTPAGGSRGQVDLVVRVRLRGGEDALVVVHVEVQAQRDPHFELRMHLYGSRLFDRYRCPVFSLAVLADASPDWRPSRYEVEIWGCRQLTSFPVVKLLDWLERGEELETLDNPFALVVAAHLATQETRPDQEARLHLALHLVRRLLGKGWSRGRIDGLFHVLEGMMTLSEELGTAFDREVVRLEEARAVKLVTRSERRGLERGLERGREEGLREGRRAAIMDFAAARFGEVPEGLAEALEAVGNLEALTRLVRTAATAPGVADLLDAARAEGQGA